MTISVKLAEIKKKKKRGEHYDDDDEVLIFLKISFMILCFRMRRYHRSIRSTVNTERKLILIARQKNKEYSVKNLSCTTSNLFIYTYM